MSKNIRTRNLRGRLLLVMVKPFDELPGIHKVLSGYAGGHVETNI